MKVTNINFSFRRRSDRRHYVTHRAWFAAHRAWFAAPFTTNGVLHGLCQCATCMRPDLAVRFAEARRQGLDDEELSTVSR